MSVNSNNHCVSKNPLIRVNYVILDRLPSRLLKENKTRTMQVFLCYRAAKSCDPMTLHIAPQAGLP